MKTNPLATICLFFCLGIWTAKYVHIPLFFIYVACVLFLAAALVSLDRPPLYFRGLKTAPFKARIINGRSSIPLEKPRALARGASLFSLCLGIAVFLGGFLHLTNAQTYPANHISNFASEERQKVYLVGKVVSHPEVSQTFYHTKKTTFTFRVSDLKEDTLPRQAGARNDEEKWLAVEGLINVNVYGATEVCFGDELLLEGSLERAPGRRNPGGFNYREYLANQNIFGVLKVKENDAFLSLRAPKGRSNLNAEIASSPASKQKAPRNDRLLRHIFQFKQKLHNIIYAHLESEQAALLSAILLGERSQLSQQTKDLFINTGTIHILAISGLHVGLIALILLALFRALRLPRKLVFLLTILVLLGYTFLSGARASVVRATIMTGVVLLGYIINREIKIYNSLGLAALIILLFNPRYLFDAGFQLSFISVIAIVYFTPKLEQFYTGHRRFFLYLTKAGSVSLAAWLGTAPLVAFYFNIVSPIAIAANLLIIPILFLVVSVGICFLAFTYIWAPLGAIFAQTSWLALSALTATTGLFSKIPFGFFHCPNPSLLCLCGYFGLAWFLFNYKRLKLSSGTAIVIALAAANVLLWTHLLNAPCDRLSVTFLDVGLGDAVFVEFPYSGQTMLIDGGPTGENDAGRMVILPFLWQKAKTKIGAVLLSHPDDDHVGGLANVLKNVKVNYVFDSGMPKDSTSYNDYKTEALKRGPNYRPIKMGEEITGFPDVRVLVLYPPAPFLHGTAADVNNNSIVLKLVYRQVSFLFCGDVQDEAIAGLLAYRPELKSTIIKIPHHGSDEGEAAAHLFGACAPHLAVISVDRNNRFGFPAKAVLHSLEELGAQIYKTYESGAVTISTDGEAVRIETMNGAEAGI